MLLCWWLETSQSRAVRDLSTLDPLQRRLVVQLKTLLLRRTRAALVALHTKLVQIKTRSIHALTRASLNRGDGADW